MWQSVQAPNIGLLRALDDRICREQAAGLVRFPSLRRTDRLLIVSDYSGSHSGSTFESYSFLVLSREAWAQWEADRRATRGAVDLPRRRLSYKRLRDRERQRVLPHILRAAGSVPGLSFTLVVSTACGDLVEAPADGRETSALSPWRPHLWERVLRISTFVSFLITGLSSPGQDVFWISDEDSIAANPDLLRHLTNVVATISSNLLPHTLGDLRCGTTASTTDDGTLQLEDLAAIPDHVAGATAALHSCYAAEGIQLGSIVAPAPASLGWRAHMILDWLSDPTLSLTRLVLLIEPGAPEGGFSIERVRLHGTRAA